MSGWGSTASEDRSGAKSSCTTNDFGPSPNTPCSSSFFFDGKYHTKCTKRRSPSSQHVVCRKFLKWAKRSNLELWGDDFSKSYRIVYWQSSTGRNSRGRYQNVTCYDPSGGDYGWCGTCYDIGFNSTKVGDHGFCADPNDGISQAIFGHVLEKLSRMNVIYEL